MQKRFSTLSERPGTGSIISAVIYSVLAFFTLPFILLLFLQGSENDTATISIIEFFSTSSILFSPLLFSGNTSPTPLMIFATNGNGC